MSPLTIYWSRIVQVQVQEQECVELELDRLEDCCAGLIFSLPAMFIVWVL